MSAPDHGTVLARHDAEIAELRQGQDELKRDVKAVLSALHEMRGSAGPSIGELLSMGSRLLTAGIVAATAFGGIVLFLARGVSSGDLRTLENRIIMLEMQVAAARK